MEALETSRSVRALRAVRDQKRGRAAGAAETGFTLVELMVVLLIMAILMAIAIPTFLGVDVGAEDRATQSVLSNALISAKAGYSNGGSYATPASSEVSVLGSYEPNIAFTTDLPASAGLNAVSVNVSTDGQEVLLVGWSKTGTCWAAVDNEGDTTAAGDASNAIANTPTVAGDEYNHWTSGSGSTCTNAVPSSGTSGWLFHY